MTNFDITQFQTLVFDCDGVVLNSNKVKTQAFYEATKHYGHEEAQALVDYHVLNGGVSRYLKMEYFLTEILGKEIEKNELNELLQRFAEAVKKGLLDCEVAKGLETFREKTKHANWLIVSGGDQDELREVFKERGIDTLFDGGIFGSPDDKTIILSRELASQNIHPKALFLGDSKYDNKAAHQAGLDFIFISDWTEVKDWKQWTNTESLNSVQSIKDFLL